MKNARCFNNNNIFSSRGRIIIIITILGVYYYNMILSCKNIVFDFDRGDRGTGLEFRVVGFFFVVVLYFPFRNPAAVVIVYISIYNI